MQLTTAKSKRSSLLLPLNILMPGFRFPLCLSTGKLKNWDTAFCMCFVGGLFKRLRMAPGLFSQLPTSSLQFNSALMPALHLISRNSFICSLLYFLMLFDAIFFIMRSAEKHKCNLHAINFDHSPKLISIVYRTALEYPSSILLFLAFDKKNRRA